MKFTKYTGQSLPDLFFVLLKVEGSIGGSTFLYYKVGIHVSGEQKFYSDGGFVENVKEYFILPNPSTKTYPVSSYGGLQATIST